MINSTCNFIYFRSAFLSHLNIYYKRKDTSMTQIKTSGPLIIPMTNDYLFCAWYCHQRQNFYSGYPDQPEWQWCHKFGTPGDQSTQLGRALPQLSLPGFWQPADRRLLSGGQACHTEWPFKFHTFSIAYGILCNLSVVKC